MKCKGTDFFTEQLIVTYQNVFYSVPLKLFVFKRISQNILNNNRLDVDTWGVGLKMNVSLD